MKLAPQFLLIRRTPSALYAKSLIITRCVEENTDEIR